MLRCIESSSTLILTSLLWTKRAFECYRESIPFGQIWVLFLLEGGNCLRLALNVSGKCEIIALINLQLCVACCLNCHSKLPHLRHSASYLKCWHRSADKAVDDSTIRCSNLEQEDKVTLFCLTAMAALINFLSTKGCYITLSLFRNACHSVCEVIPKWRDLQLTLILFERFFLPTVSGGIWTNMLVQSYIILSEYWDWVGPGSKSRRVSELSESCSLFSIRRIFQMYCRKHVVLLINT